MDQFPDRIEPRPAHDDEIARAREFYTLDTEDIEVDDNALVSDSRLVDADGYWVQAWLWIQDEQDPEPGER